MCVLGIHSIFSVCVLSACCAYVCVCSSLCVFMCCVRLCNVKTTQCAVTFCLSTAESLWVRRLQHQPALCGPNTTRGCTLIGTDSSAESGRERRWGRHEGKTKKKKETYLRIWHDVEFEFEDEGKARATNLYCTLYSLPKFNDKHEKSTDIYNPGKFLNVFLLSCPRFHTT